MAFSALNDPSINLQSQIESISSELKSLESDYKAIFDYWLSFRSICKKEIDVSHYEDCTPTFPCVGHHAGDNSCSNTINAIIEESTRIMNDFKADRKLEELPFNTEQIHKYDKHRLCNFRERALSQWDEHCFFHTEMSHSQFVSWYEIALKHLNIIESKISPMKFDLDFRASLFSARLGQFHTKLDYLHKHLLKSVVSAAKNGSSATSSSFDEKKNRKLAHLMEKLSKDTERNNLAVGESNDRLRSMTEELKGLEIVDRSAGAITIGGASDSFFSQDPYLSNSFLDSMNRDGSGDSH